MVANEDYILDRIKAIEAWSIKVHNGIWNINNITDHSIEEILENLKQINYEGRRLEWRGNGLRGLPDHGSVKDLKKMISSIRASCQQITPLIEKVRKDLREKKIPLQKTLSQLNLTKKYCISMMDQAKQAIEIVNEKKWDWDILPVNDLLDLLIKKKGYYKSFSHERVIEIFNRYQVGVLSGQNRPLEFFYGSRNLEGVNFSGLNLTRAEFGHLGNVHFKLTGANFSRANLYRADLSDATLDDADMSHANMITTMLSRASLKRANLEHANLTFSNPYGVDFTEADLSNAILHGAVVHESIFKDTNLSGATVTDVDFSKVKTFLFVNLNGVIYNSKTKWPQGTILPKTARMV